MAASILKSAWTSGNRPMAENSVVPKANVPAASAGGIQRLEEMGGGVVLS
ncbi:hypothetical protein [Sphingomonas abietis]|nr:hypothetical protein [Sphingomonas abietis]